MPRLRLRRRAVDFVRQNEVRENRAGLVVEFDAPAGFPEDFRPEDIAGHDFRSELNPVELQPERFGQRTDEQGLGEARHPDEQAVALTARYPSTYPGICYRTGRGGSAV